MNLLTRAGDLPINHHAYHHVLPSKDLSMFVSASPRAGNDKIRAIQTHKPRSISQSYRDLTDIRPLNIGNNSCISNPITRTFSNFSPEKLVERNKKLRLDPISTRQNPRPSVLSTTYQQSFIWPSYNSPTGSTKQSQVNSSTVPPTVLRPTMNKSSTCNMPDIHQRSSRAPTTTIGQSLAEQKNSLIPIDSRHTSLPKIKCPLTSSNIQPLQMSHNDYSKRLNNNNNVIHFYENKDDDENIPSAVNEEYVQKATVKCAYWLIKYFPDKKCGENDE
jgi:hypothetical protein